MKCLFEERDGAGEKSPARKKEGPKKPVGSASENQKLITRFPAGTPCINFRLFAFFYPDIAALFIEKLSRLFCGFESVEQSFVLTVVFETSNYKVIHSHSSFIYTSVTSPAIYLYLQKGKTSSSSALDRYPQPRTFTTFRHGRSTPLIHSDA